MHDSPYISHVFRINSTHSSIRPVAGSRVPGTNTHTVCLRMWSSSVVYKPCYFASIQTYPALLPLSTNLPDQAPGRSCWLSAAPEKTRHAAAEPVGKAGYRPRGPRPAQRPCASLPRRAGRSMWGRFERGAGFMVSAYKKTWRDAASRAAVASPSIWKCGNATGDWFSDLCGKDITTAPSRRRGRIKTNLHRHATIT